MQRFEQASEFKERLVAVNRVSKTVKGGRNMRFSALVVVGDENGRVGAGMGKAAEIPEAIRKANEDAKKHLVNVPLDGTTIPHEMTGYYSTAKSVLIPGARVGVIYDWSTRWYAGKKDFASNLVEDYKLRKMLKEKYYSTGISPDPAAGRRDCRVCFLPGFLRNGETIPGGGAFPVLPDRMDAE